MPPAGWSPTAPPGFCRPTGDLYDVDAGGSPLDVHVANLPAGVSNLPAGVSNLPAGVSNLPADLRHVPTGVSDLIAEVPDLPARVANIPAGMPALPAKPVHVRVDRLNPHHRAGPPPHAHSEPRPVREVIRFAEGD